MDTGRPEDRCGEKSFSICFVALDASSLFGRTSKTSMIGGAEVQQYRIARELIHEGASVSFVIKEDPNVAADLVDSIRLLKAYKPSSGVRFLRSVYPQFICLWRQLKVANCSVYYVRGAKYESGIVWLYCALHRKTMVQAIAHDYDCDLKTLHNLKGVLKKYLYGRAIRGADLVFAQTAEQQNLLRERMNVESTIIPNLMSVTCGLAGKERRRIKRLLWVATVKPIKKPLVFIELAKKFHNLAFTMIGPISNKHVPYREAIIKEAKEVKNLRFLDFVPANEIEKYFRETDLFISSSDKEGFPNVVLQAWACGTPVVSFVDPGKVIQEHGAGWIAGNESEMAELIADLASGNRSEDLEAVSRNSVDYVRRTHSSDAVIRKVISEISAVVKVRC